MRGILALLLALTFLPAPAFAQVGAITGAISSFCSDLSGILPIAAMLMSVLAAVVYTSGQIMGAQTCGQPPASQAL